MDDKKKALVALGLLGLGIGVTVAASKKAVAQPPPPPPPEEPPLPPPPEEPPLPPPIVQPPLPPPTPPPPVLSASLDKHVIGVRQALTLSYTGMPSDANFEVFFDDHGVFIGKVEPHFFSEEGFSTNEQIPGTGLPHPSGSVSFEPFNRFPSEDTTGFIRYKTYNAWMKVMRYLDTIATFALGEVTLVRPVLTLEDMGLAYATVTLISKVVGGVMHQNGVGVAGQKISLIDLTSRAPVGTPAVTGIDGWWRTTLTYAIRDLRVFRAFTQGSVNELGIPMNDNVIVSNDIQVQFV